MEGGPSIFSPSPTTRGCNLRHHRTQEKTKCRLWEELVPVCDGSVAPSKRDSALSIAKLKVVAARSPRLVRPMLGPHRKPCDTPRAYARTAAPRRDARWVMPATILGSSVSYVDESAVNVALPAMRQSLEASFGTMQWVFNAYMLTLATLILLGGAIGDRFGRRRVFLVGLAGFGASSIVAGLAPTAGWLIAARLAQGASAALLMPVSLAIIGAAYAGPDRGRAIGTWAAAGAVAIALSRPLGGWLVDAFSWRAVFFANLPLIAAAFVFGLLLAPDGNREEPERVDIRGALLAILGLGLLSFGLIALGEGTVLGAVPALAAVPILWAFGRFEARAKAPMTPLWLFRSLEFAGVNALTFVYYASLSAVFFMLPFVLIDVYRYSAAEVGAAFLPLSVIMALGSRWSGSLVEKFGARGPLILGSLVTVGGYVILLLSSGASRYLAGFLPGLVLVGVGVTLTVAPLTTAVFDSAPPDRTGAASGINNAIDVTGGLLAIAALGFAVTGSSSEGPASPGLLDAYRVVMLAAAVLTAVSAAIAALTISARAARHPRR